MTNRDKMWTNDMPMSAPIGLCCFDAQLRCVHVNQRLAEINRHSIAEHWGRELSEVVPAVTPQIEQQLRAALNSGEQVFSSIVECKADAESAVSGHFQHNFYAIRSRAGDLHGVCCTVHDVSAMVQARKELRKRESRLLSILDSSLDSIVTIDTTGIIESVNHTTLRMFGYGEEELLGQNVAILMPEPFRSNHDGYLRRFLQTGEARIIGIGREIVCRRNDGSTFPAELSVTETKEDDNLHIFTGTIRDISERKSAEARIQQRERELAHIARLSTMGEMAAGLAHELNQPLGAISNFAGNCVHLIDKGAIHELRADLEEIVALTARCGDIIRRIRQYVKKREPNREPIDLAQTVGNVMAFIKRDAQFNHVDVRVELPETPLTIFGDSIQIEQVLLNLARNAIDAMVEVPRTEKILTIKAESTGQEEVAIGLRDTGIGIAPDMLAKVCEPFVSTKSDGLGMGLSICKTIVDAHHGYMEITSDQASGTLVRVILPKSDDGFHGHQ